MKGFEDHTKALLMKEGLGRSFLNEKMPCYRAFWIE